MQLDQQDQAWKEAWWTRASCEHTVASYAKTYDRASVPKLGRGANCLGLAKWPRFVLSQTDIGA